MELIKYYTIIALFLCLVPNLWQVFKIKPKNDLVIATVIYTHGVTSLIINLLINIWN